MTNYEIWQLENYGNVVQSFPGLAPENDYQIIIESRIEQNHISETNNLRDDT